jgi:hypothetical protein
MCVDLGFGVLSLAAHPRVGASSSSVGKESFSLRFLLFRDKSYFNNSTGINDRVVVRPWSKMLVAFAFLVNPVESHKSTSQSQNHVMSETSWHIAGGTVLPSSRLEPCFTRLHASSLGPKLGQRCCL